MSNGDYRFIDKDPVVDLVRTAVFESGLLIKNIAADAKVHPNTISRWLYGDVRRPQSYTTWRVLQALGVETVYVYKATGKRLEARHDIGDLLKKDHAATTKEKILATATTSRRKKTPAKRRSRDPIKKASPKHITFN